MLGTLELMWSHQERQWAERAQDSGSYPSREAKDEVLDVHRSLLDAIDRGDADYAADLAGAHLRASQRFTLTGDGNRTVQAAPMQGGRPQA
jgi:GntR family transcriptional repressor for pyruvate dehydrogenase complex